MEQTPGINLVDYDINGALMQCVEQGGGDVNRLTLNTQFIE